MKKLTDTQIETWNKVYGYPKEFNRRIERERPIWDAQECRMIKNVKVMTMWLIFFGVSYSLLAILWLGGVL